MAIKVNTNTLYITGNGFDLHHKLDTYYSTFGLFLRDNHSDIYDYFLNYFGFPDLDEDDPDSLEDPLWSQFEANLATLDIDEVLDDHAQFSANPGSDDFSDGDWDTIAVYVSQIRDDLTIKMLDLFKEFILNVSYPDKSGLNILNLDRNAIFFNFNYSKSLEHYYKIPQSRILYIHNRAESKDNLILGHGMDPKKFEKEDPKPPTGLNEEELDQWEEAQSDIFDFSLERGRDELIQYFSKSFKATSLLIEKNKGFFNSLKSIREVFVLGHSLAEVDKEYFDEILKSISNNAVWIVSYRNPNEKEARIKRLNAFGIKNIQIILVQMTDLRPEFWSKIKLTLRIALSVLRNTIRI
ncbi:bacteriophage abortive infection AbiH family protein [Aquiflexum gelatinilyticum]|uniref:bacteriophage abortive infection AbiH family protein n=1 Tax=Aquiflexum gelatinilyticum TaxID=2961943 RepID=UPI0021697153|nr:bacteriophage abortive infection AbiH family protein [Aquiflexum gelatinilyticum]MCS4436183.1 bacteriophage abortive infection AbiH family protein [Aquiflexum gelatinilyticum]